MTILEKFQTQLFTRNMNLKEPKKCVRAFFPKINNYQTVESQVLNSKCMTPNFRKNVKSNVEKDRELISLTKKRRCNRFQLKRKVYALSAIEKTATIIAVLFCTKVPDALTSDTLGLVAHFVFLALLSRTQQILKKLGQTVDCQSRNN